MATAPLKYRPGRTATATGRPPDRRRNSAERGYGRRWRRASKIFLVNNPLCVECEAEGVITAAAVVDHRKPHRGDAVLFWDETNWQGMCVPHHNRKSAKEKRAAQDYRG